MDPLLTKYRKGFPWGETVVASYDDPANRTGISFTIIKLKEGQSITLSPTEEMALLHLQGDGTFLLADQSYKNKRTSLFDDLPFAIHVSSGTSVMIEAESDLEMAKFETINPKKFPPVIYLPSKTKDEHRGMGLVRDTSLRFVRTIFDGSTSHPSTELVLGEVINFPGRWSSYPPHHHPQPEIYHYRFTSEKGYGHAELGDAVYKVRPNDTLFILDENDHAQCSAPGYGMYYIWVIRHLPDNRYTVPEFNDDHSWTMDPDAPVWHPKEMANV